MRYFNLKQHKLKINWSFRSQYQYQYQRMYVRPNDGLRRRPSKNWKFRHTVNRVNGWLNARLNDARRKECCLKFCYYFFVVMQLKDKNKKNHETSVYFYEKSVEEGLRLHLSCSLKISKHLFVYLTLVLLS